MAYIPRPRKVNYLNNKDILAQILLSKEQGKVSDELAKMIMMLVQKYSKHPNYMNIHSYKEDMEAYAILYLFKVCLQFNPDKSDNPFAYFTQVTKHAFYAYLNGEKKQREVKNLLAAEIGVSDSEMGDTGFNEEEVFGRIPTPQKGDEPVFDA